MGMGVNRTWGHWGGATQHGNGEVQLSKSHLWCTLIQYVRLIVPPRPLQEEAAAVHPIRGRLAAVTVTILDDEIKVNVVDGDLKLARIVLLGAGQEGLGEERSGRAQ